MWGCPGQSPRRRHKIDGAGGQSLRPYVPDGTKRTNGAENLACISKLKLGHFRPTLGQKLASIRPSFWLHISLNSP